MPAAANPARSYILVGETVPNSLTVIDTEGRTRPAISYRTPTDLLVLTFISPDCDQNSKEWPVLRRLYERYKDWHVKFLAVSAGTGEHLEALAELMKKEKLPYTVVRDEQKELAAALHVSLTPTIVILDEWSQLRYRGPAEKAAVALDTAIGHIEPIRETEPPVAGCPLP
jgi:peroxiredoxin